jgi:type I restriction enzyme S subunit
MKSGWQTSTLGDVLAVIRNGVNCKQDKSGNGDRISRIESISDATFDLDRVGYAELSERDKEKNRLRPGDILFSHINSAVHVGKTAVFDCEEPVYHGVNLLLMRPKEVVTSAYLDHALKYLFQSGYWRGVCKQSVNQASVNQQDISRVRISYPKALAEQRRIVGLLDEVFEGLATAKANAEKNLQNARALFESHLQSVFTQRGKGWVEKTLEELGTITSSKRIFKSEYVKSGVPFYRTKEIKELANRRDITTELFISDVRYNEIKAAFGVPKQGDILLTAIGTIGEIYVVQGSNDFYFKDGNVLWLKGFTTIDPHFLRYVLVSFVESLNKMAHGSAYSALTIQRLNTHKIFVPSPAEQAAIVSQLDSLREEIQRLASLYERKVAALDALKQSLLHQAFTGKL